jgi:PAS domain S-box-containing protein
LLGYTTDQILNMGSELFRTVVHPDDQSLFTEVVLNLASNGPEKVIETRCRIRHSNNPWRWLLLRHVALQRKEDGTPLQLLGVAIDITSQIEAEEKLIKSEENYRRIFENAPIGIFHSTPEGKFLDVNPQIARMLKYDSPDDIIQVVNERTIDDVLYVTPELRQKYFQEAALEGEWISHENWYVCKDGSLITGKLLARVVKDVPDKEPFVEGFVQNISAQKKAENELLASLHEKEILLKEIHHRVKNNLMLVSSLLDLQMEKMTDPSISQLLNESQHRIRAIARLHEALYRSEDLRSIHVREYFEDLTNHLFMTYGNKAEGVNLIVDIEDITLDIDTAIPSGLILNELLSNALKHAFPPNFVQKKNAGKVQYIPQIQVRFFRVGVNYQLAIHDNGVGFNIKQKLANSQTLGLQLVGLFAQQLGGEVHIDPNEKVGIVVEFPDPQAKTQGDAK